MGTKLRSRGSTLSQRVAFSQCPIFPPNVRFKEQRTNTQAVPVHLYVFPFQKMTKTTPRMSTVRSTTNSIPDPGRQSSHISSGRIKKQQHNRKIAVAARLHGRISAKYHGPLAAAAARFFSSTSALAFASARSTCNCCCRAYSFPRATSPQDFRKR